MTQKKPKTAKFLYSSCRLWWVQAGKWQHQMFRESRASSWRHVGNPVWLPVGFTSCWRPLPAAGLWNCPNDTRWTVLRERKWICLERHIQLQEEWLTPERLPCECERSWWMPCWKSCSCGMFRWAAERSKRRTEKLLWGLQLYHKAALCEMLLVSGNSKNRAAPQGRMSWGQQVRTTQSVCPYPPRHNPKHLQRGQRKVQITRSMHSPRQGKVINQM